MKTTNFQTFKNLLRSKFGLAVKEDASEAETIDTMEQYQAKASKLVNLSEDVTKAIGMAVEAVIVSYSTKLNKRIDDTNQANETAFSELTVLSEEQVTDITKKLIKSTDNKLSQLSQTVLDVSKEVLDLKEITEGGATSKPPKHKISAELKSAQKAITIDTEAEFN